MVEFDSGARGGPRFIVVEVFPDPGVPYITI